ncbi:MAG: MarR family transcriptional regulator [Sphaerochaetaceae bacterium]|nr:MarR family transcriptional regulator [Sphaerochaetaceae bacterium]
MPETYEELKLENQLCFPLYACAKEVVRQYRKPLEEFNLTYTQYIVMLILWEYGDMSEGQLGEKIHLESGTLAPLLKRLEKSGYISRSREKNNERRLAISLTKEGLALKEKIRQVPEKIHGCIPLPDEDLILLRALLNKVLDKMNNKEKEID